MSVSPLQTRKLRRSETPAQYNLYKAALEWSLVDPIVIESKEDLRSEKQWREKLQPFSHQITNLITFCRRLPVTLLADDVGLGKTISAGLVASELISRNRVSKILVVCPKILMPQWKEELDTKFGIPSIEATGRELINIKFPEEACAVITTYQSARLHFESIGKAGYEMLVLDEAHKLRNLYGVEKTPQVAIKFRQALADRLFKYVLMLTATPIQNRLWDLYSLIDLLAVARGHENPFGTEGMFARNFIQDDRTEARKLRPEKKDEFRSIIYGYMSRIRRGDANLHFPSRKVQLHRVKPTPEEIEIIDFIAEPIQKLNRLTQISILQAVVSSPHALLAQLEKMAINRTAPKELAEGVRAIVARMKTTAKLQGLTALVEQLKKDQGIQWRMVIFTCRRETQTTIEAFLGGHGIRCGLINGDSGSRNQQTITKFKKSPPDINVIVSTEAGSEGVNLQAANILVNYDLPWNPMIVEQRIGRIQRLASLHENVCIYNAVLQDTFEEYIVGRLMEKLQMASHAIGDIEALLEAAGMDEEGDPDNDFSEKIRQLVISSLAGKDVEKATQLTEKSIVEAKKKLEFEEKNINAMLGGMDGAIDLGPRCPKLPLANKSMDIKSFVLQTLESFGGAVRENKINQYEVKLDGRSESIYFNEDQKILGGTLCKPGAPFFERLISRISNTSLFLIEDLDEDPLSKSTKTAKDWINTFEGSFTKLRLDAVKFCFTGIALLRVRATVAHDSYERLIEINCLSEGSFIKNQDLLRPLSGFIEDPLTLGLPVEHLRTKALEDIGVAEFCRFYQERLIEEVKSAGEDLRKKKKLEDDFTPRLEMSLVGLDGKIHRQLSLYVSFQVGTNENYDSFLTILPSENSVLEQPAMEACSLSQKIVPSDCLGKCVISSTKALKHLLSRSEISGRLALSEYTSTCALSGKRVLSDEVEKSAKTGRSIASALLKSSALSGKRAEPEFFDKCEFSSSEVLKEELIASQISGKHYRMDQTLRSIVSGKAGHQSEFIVCAQTNQPLLPEEAEHCELTGKAVAPGKLGNCEISNKKVLPDELEKCAISGKRALKKYLVSSSVSQLRFLEELAVKSNAGKLCAPSETKTCLWSGHQYHPVDIRICELLDLPFHFEFVIEGGGQTRFKILDGFLNAKLANQDKSELWEVIANRTSKAIGGLRCKIEGSKLSLDNQFLVGCVEARNWIGLNARYAGVFYSLKDNSIVGHIPIGKREVNGWKRLVIGDR